MARQWRCAVIGTGTVGEWHVRTIPKLPNCQLVAVCDVENAKGSGALKKNSLEAPVYTDIEEMYRTEKIDVVHVCTPSGDHKSPAIHAMEHGKNVVVEKPMEIHPDRIDDMIAAAKKQDVKLAGIFQNRWNEANRAIRDAVAAGRFGRIAWAGSFTPWYRNDEYYEKGGWRGTWRMDGGGSVMNQGVHQVDLMQWIVGPVKTVSAYASSRIHPKIEVEDTLTCAFQFESGAFGTFVSTTAMWPGGPTRFEVGGENGTAISENGLKRFEFREVLAEDAALLERLNPARAKTTGGGKSATDIGLDFHGMNMRDIYAAWDRGEEAETCGPEARKAVSIIHAMYESVRKNGAPIDVK
ncbi:MAG: Gfo/Idh/MocA family oxidoreductase [Planctomycetota bacterium]|nr:Gfo/Idh/MocA family oxidoreductase [Planctomycetota bacterium]